MNFAVKRRINRKGQLTCSETVIPAQAGIQTKDVPPVLWIPACAGMTIRAVSNNSNIYAAHNPTLRLFCTCFNIPNQFDRLVGTHIAVHLIINDQHGSETTSTEAGHRLDREEHVVGGVFGLG